MKGHLEVGGTMIEVEVGDQLCLKCKHFDIKAYEKDIVIDKRGFSWDACKSNGVIWEDCPSIACSNFEPKEVKQR